MNIAIDIDDTVCNTSSFYLELATKYDRDVLHKNSYFDPKRVVARSDEWTKEEFDYYIQNIFNKNTLNIPLKEQASFYINKLKEKDYKITFITNRGSNEDDHSDLNTPLYLKNNNILYDELITKAKDKYKYLNNSDYFIDDSIKECELVYKNCSCKVIMMASVKNKDYINNDIVKLSTWEEIYNYITKSSR